MKEIQTEIQIKQLALVCHIGVPKTERASKQVIIVDIICNLTDPRISADSMTASVDYGPIVKRTLAIVAEYEFVLLETLAATIASMVLELEPRIRQVTVSCNKPNKYPNCQAVGVRRTFGR